MYIHMYRVREMCSKIVFEKTFSCVFLQIYELYYCYFVRNDLGYTIYIYIYVNVYNVVNKF